MAFFCRKGLWFRDGKGTPHYQSHPAEDAVRAGMVEADNLKLFYTAKVPFFNHCIPW